MRRSSSTRNCVWYRNPHHLQQSIFKNLSNSTKTLGNTPKVRFLSSPLKNPGFPRVFRISGQLLWPSVAPMLARCMAPCGVAFRVAHPNSSRFSSRDGSAKYWGLAWPNLAPIHDGGGGRIRTSCAMFCRVGTMRHVRKSLSPDQIFDTTFSIRYYES